MDGSRSCKKWWFFRNLTLKLSIAPDSPWKIPGGLIKEMAKFPCSPLFQHSETLGCSGPSLSKVTFIGTMDPSNRKGLEDSVAKFLFHQLSGIGSSFVWRVRAAQPGRSPKQLVSMAEMLQERRLFPQSLCLHRANCSELDNMSLQDRKKKQKSSNGFRFPTKIMITVLLFTYCHYHFPQELFGESQNWNTHTHTFFFNKCLSPGSPVFRCVPRAYTTLTIPRFHGTTFTDSFHAEASILDRGSWWGKIGSFLQNHSKNLWFHEVSPEIAFKKKSLKTTTWKSSDLCGKFAFFSTKIWMQLGHGPGIPGNFFLSLFLPVGAMSHDLSLIHRKKCLQPKCNIFVYIESKRQITQKPEATFASCYVITWIQGSQALLKAFPTLWEVSIPTCNGHHVIFQSITDCGKNYTPKQADT